jgi:hypothetical protein
MELEKIIEEIYDSPSGNYSASSEAPRKDFAPISKTNGYSYPYQRGGTSDNLTSPPPDAPTSYPWPLQTVEDDLSDSFVFLATAMSKIAQSVKNNPTITSEQKEKAIFLYKKSKKALMMIKDIGIHIGDVFNMSEQQPDQNHIIQKSPKDESLPDKGDMVRIKVS